MKKLIQILTVLMFSVLCVHAQAGSGQKFTAQNFINGIDSPAAGGQGQGKSGALLITNSATASVFFGQTNVVYYVQGQPFGVNYGTNNTLVTNALINPYAWAVSTNTFYVQYVSGGTANTNQQQPWGPAIVDAMLYSDNDGSVPVPSIEATITGDSATSTNSTNTFVFCRAINIGGFIYPATNSQTFSFSVTANGTNPVTVITNLPAYFCQGASRIRLFSIQCGTNTASTNTYVNSLALTGFTP